MENYIRHFATSLVKLVLLIYNLEFVAEFLSLDESIRCALKWFIPAKTNKKKKPWNLEFDNLKCGTYAQRFSLHVRPSQRLHFWKCLLYVKRPRASQDFKPHVTRSLLGPCTDAIQRINSNKPGGYSDGVNSYVCNVLWIGVGIKYLAKID